MCFKKITHVKCKKVFDRKIIWKMSTVAVNFKNQQINNEIIIKMHLSTAEELSLGSGAGFMETRSTRSLII